MPTNAFSDHERSNLITRWASGTNLPRLMHENAGSGHWYVMGRPDQDWMECYAMATLAVPAIGIDSPVGATGIPKGAPSGFGNDAPQSETGGCRK